MPDYIIKGDSTYFVVSDHLGSIRLVVNSVTGNVVQEINYDAYGSMLFDSNPGWQPFGYAGGLYDVHTQLTRFGARDYDPSVGRWTNKDPIGFGGMVSNLYEYSKNDPINNLDISGHQTLGSEILSGVLQDINNAWNGIFGTLQAGVDNVNQTIVKQGPGVLDQVSEGLTYAAVAGFILGPFTEGAGFIFAGGALATATGLDFLSLGLSSVDYFSYGGSLENVITRTTNFTLKVATAQAYRYFLLSTLGKVVSKEISTALLELLQLGTNDIINKSCPIQ
ncbi:RHS repeat-associated core domain-containing protein [Bacteroidota bacterium]